MEVKMILPKQVERIISTLNNYGYEAFAVGGCVRDSLSKKTPNDFDICTSATPSEMKSVFKQNQMKTYDTGIKHGTISVRCNGELYEITTYRIDGEYADGRHPNEVVFTKDVKEDLARRDFTINAMAYNHKDGLVDPFDGESDLKSGIVRCVGDPTDRFHEDALRILRAIRFAIRFNFDIEENTAKSLLMNRKLLTNISAERKADELIKILMDLNQQNMHLMLDYKEVFAEIIPELRESFDFDQHSDWHDYDVYKHLIMTVANSKKDEKIRLAAFLHDIAKPRVATFDADGHGHFKNHAAAGSKMSEKILRTLKMDNDTIKSVRTMIAYHTPMEGLYKPNIKRWMRDIGVDETKRCLELIYADTMSRKPEEKLREPVDELDAVLSPECYMKKHAKEVKNAFKTIDEILNKKECFDLKGLAVNGKDLVNAGLNPGKEMGEILDSLLERVIVNPNLNKKQYLIELAKIRYEVIQERKNKEN